ncbi:Uncharacterised protein [Mycobacteroides abscessus subsp. abscessus]|nr:Uncharacterised protein [Mycobacteroides abscessus subsp. abscessus]
MRSGAQGQPRWIRARTASRRDRVMRAIASVRKNRTISSRRSTTSARTRWASPFSRGSRAASATWRAPSWTASRAMWPAVTGSLTTPPTMGATIGRARSTQTSRSRVDGTREGAGDPVAPPASRTSRSALASQYRSYPHAVTKAVIRASFAVHEASSARVSASAEFSKRQRNPRSRAASAGRSMRSRSTGMRPRACSR